jgi:predicted protein tyrosine phosphatase
MGTPELIVLSRDRAERYEPQGVEVCISITDAGAPQVQLSPRFAAVLRLEFDDVAAEDDPRHRAFRAEDADRIVEFIARSADAERIVVHCVGGASRSPGVALGLCDLYGWPVAATAIERSKPFWNSLVRRVLAERSPASPGPTSS